MSAQGDRQTETIPQWKREEVDDIGAFIGQYESVGVVDITGIPSKQLQDMRRDLHGTAALRVSRNTLLKRALDEGAEGLSQLGSEISGQVGLIGTNDNPFGLYQQLEESKTPAPISAGEIAPNDIVIEEGDTGVDPGPFVGELQTIGAQAQIMDGSIHVTEDSVVCEAGEEVSQDLADVLGELGLEPKEVGLDLRAVVSEGVLFEPEELDIDVDAYRTDIQTGAARARNLAINAEYPTEATAPAIIAKARGEAKSLGLQASIESPSLADDLVSKADAQVRSLAAQIDDEEALPEELQGVESPEPAEASESEDDQAADEADESDDDAAEEAADDDDGDDDDDDGAAEGLGNMFG